MDDDRRWTAEHPLASERPLQATGGNPDRRHLLMVSPYYPPHRGGVENYVEALTREINRAPGWTVAVVTTDHAETSNRLTHCTVDDVNVYRLPIDVRLSNTPLGLQWPLQLRRIVRIERPTLVNAHAPVPGLSDIAAAVTVGVPFVLTYHTGRMRKEQPLLDWLVRGYERFVLPQTLRRANVVIASSDFARDELPRRFRNKTVTVRPGVDTDLFTSSPPDSGNRSRALFVASLDKAAAYKNLPAALLAIRALRDGGQALELAVVGDGDARHEYEQLVVSLGLSDLVVFMGTLTGRSLVDAYRRASFLILPTLFDSSPTVVMEAMACGRPVVSTFVGGIPELVTHGVDGMLVPPGDTRALAAAVGRLAADTQLRTRLGAAASLKAASSWSWSDQGRGTLSLFDRIAAQRAGGKRHVQRHASGVRGNR